MGVDGKGARVGVGGRRQLCSALPTVWGGVHGSEVQSSGALHETEGTLPPTEWGDLYRLQAAGALVRDALSLRLTAEHADRMDGELAAGDLRELDEPCEPVSDGAGGVGDGDRGEGGTQQGQDAGTVRDELRGVEGAGDGGGDGGGAWVTGTTATTSTQVVARRRQTTLDVHVGNKVQQDIDRLLALAIYRGGVPFSWLRLKETQDYWNYIVTLLRPSIVPVPRLLTYEGVRMRMMDIIFHEVADLIAPKKAKWATTECTLLTDGATDTINKPIKNFIAAGQSGPILIRTIDMSHREKTEVGLAEIWEGVIRDDIGIDKVNAICTDNAEVMKTAAGILQSHPDPRIRRIPWIPCAAHCLSLLPRDIAAQPWATTVMRKADHLVKFMRNKQRALALHKTMRNALVLKRPAERRFGTAFMMLERLYEQRGVLDKLVSGESWAQVRWTSDARRDEPEVRRMCTGNSLWGRVKMVLDVMAPCFRFLRDMDRDGSSPTGLWDLESILRGRVKALGLTEDERRAVMDIISDRCRMMRQPAHAAAYLLDPRRRIVEFPFRGPSLLAEDWSALVDEFAVKDAAEGGMHAAMWWEVHGRQQPRLQMIAKRVLGMWSTASPCERNWSTHDFIHTKRRNRLSVESVEKLVFIHWNLELLSASRRTDSRYIDVWEDQVEDPAEEIDVDDSVPAAVPEEEWEEIDRRNMRKEGRNRFGKGKAPMEDEDEDEEGDEALWQDAVWMHREMMEAGQEQRDAGCTLPEDQHDLLDEWGGADPHINFDAYIGQSVDTVRSLRGRVGGGLDFEELLGVGQEEERSQHVPHSSTAGEGGHTGVVSVDTCTSASAAPHHAAERILRGAEEMIGREGHHADDRPEDTHQRVEQRVDGVVHDRAEQRVDQRIEHRRERRDGHSLEVQVDVTMDESVVRRTEDRGSERRGVASTREMSPGSALHHPPSVTLRCPAAHASGASTSSAAAGPPVRSPLGMPPLPARLQSAIVDNVKTSRAGRKRRREDDGGALPPPPRQKVGTGRPRGCPRGSGSGRGRGRGRDSRAMSALEADDAGEEDVGQCTTACTGLTVGVRTRSQASTGVPDRKSTRIIDDDSDASSSDGLSGSDYVDERDTETRARGEDESGHDDSSNGNGHEDD
ncbi:hypothetical protein CBR_g2710 [Chara braunii]|uniref:DUF659 domain-containing protein n=1 Tax=Chara braunii TaxID=69332 RepID=A0A388KDN7_CHABU|nr:hypothetical protein CBR_g2710 [Chara braunii]|eukprot:GBG68159.1 hypothetical protein CBR_g2710 [Chara braunii]